MLKLIGKILILLAFTAIALGIGACGESGSPALRYTRWAGGNEAVDFQALVDTYVKLNPGVTIETEFLPWGAYWEKLRTSVLSGDAADVISLAGAEMAPYITKKAFLKMNDLEGAKALLDEMQPAAQGPVQYEGTLYAMPVGVGVRAMVYNKALLDEANIPYPSSTEPMTWDDFIAMGKKLTKKKGTEIIQYAAHFHKQEMYESLINQMGGRLMDNYTKPTKVLINTPEAVAGLDLMLRLIKEDVLPPHTGEWTGPWGTPDAAIGTGKVAFMQAGPWGLNSLDRDGEIKYGTAPLPRAKSRANRGYVNALAIYKDSRNAAAAWKFIRWMCSAEGQLEFTKTGDLPANARALGSARQSPSRPAEVMDAYFSELPYTIFGPMLPSKEFDSLLDDALTQMLQLKVTSKAAAERIEREGDQIIKGMFAQ